MLFFKTNREQEEFNDPRLDKRVRIIVLALNGEMEQRFGLSLIVSGVNRTRKEQISYYGYFKPSSHFYWRAVDLRVYAMEQTLGSGFIDYEEVKMTSEHLNFIDEWVDEHFLYDMTDEQKYETSLVHEVVNEKTGKSAGQHIHIQATPRSTFTRIKR